MNLAMALCYFVAARLGLMMALEPGVVTAVWPPSGIALAGLLLFGFRILPGIWFGCFAIHYYAFVVADPSDPLISVILGGAVISTGNTLAACLGCLLIKYFSSSANFLRSISNTIKFIIISAPLSCIVAASVGITTLLIGGSVQPQNFWEYWLTWWLGDTTGVILFTPLILAYWYKPALKYSNKDKIGITVLLLLLIVLSEAVFIGFFIPLTEYPFSFLPLSVLVFSAYLYGPRGATLGCFLLGVIAVIGTVLGNGPFALTELNSGLLMLQTYLAVAVTCSLVLATVNEEMAVTAEALKETAAKADEANRAKSSFLANMSHEIRTPVSVILGYSELLGDESLTANSRNEYIETIQRNSKYLVQLISDVLDISKIEAQQLEINKETFNLSMEISQVLLTFQKSIEDKNLTLTIEHKGLFPEFITTDALLLRQILVNLISNAIKFSNKGTIKLTIGLTPPPSGDSPGKLQFKVIDTGKGIHRSNQKKIFTLFSQEDSSISRKYGGTGLGLHLSRQLIRALGGEIELTSSVEGKGSEFTFTIDPGYMSGIRSEQLSYDLSTYAEIETRVPLKLDLELEDVNILIIDDNKEILTFVENILCRRGARISIALSGEEGVKKALKNPFDAILMDLPNAGPRWLHGFV